MPNRSLTRVPSTGDLMVMWNNVESRSNWPRTPLSVAISTDEGQTWGHYHDIDARPDRDAAYPSVFSKTTRPWSRITRVRRPGHAILKSC